MRGERPSSVKIGVCPAGSAPHARGTREDGLLQSRRGRFSPACAGNAGDASRRAPARTVQPRIRGERICHRFPKEVESGSAPHARGTHGVDLVAVPGQRFSPACAGNALTANSPHCPITVQPRMRGERTRWERAWIRWAGSAPHARGTRRTRVKREVAARFSPACAGNAFRGPPGWSA